MDSSSPITKVDQFNQLVRGLVTLALIAAFILMSLRGITVSEAMLVIITNVTTYWFASRDQKAAIAAVTAASVAAKNGKDTPPVPPSTA